MIKSALSYLLGMIVKFRTEYIHSVGSNLQQPSSPTAWLFQGWPKVKACVMMSNMKIWLLQNIAITVTP